MSFARSEDVAELKQKLQVLELEVQKLQLQNQILEKKIALHEVNGHSTATSTHVDWSKVTRHASQPPFFSDGLGAK